MTASPLDGGGAVPPLRRRLDPALVSGAEGGQAKPPSPVRAPGGATPGGTGRSLSPGRDRPATDPSGDAAAQYAASPGGATWTIELPAGITLLSLNRPLHWAKHRKVAEALRDAGIILARQAKIPPLQRARIIAEYQPPTSRGRRDAENIPIPSAKPVIDGLVKAGVLPDDACPRYVEEIVGRVGEPYPRGRLRLIIREVAP